MILIKTPAIYINEVGILKTAGVHISQYGRNALIIGGKIALSVVGHEFFKSLEEHNVKYTVKQFSGFVTTKEIQEYEDYAREAKADFIIGVGGGKVIDLSKVVGDNLKLDVVAVPTIASTCAAWSALSTLYNEDGSAKGAVIQVHSPVLVLADADIIANAPVKYLKAGIGDTVAKYYEYAPKIKGASEDIALLFSLQTAKLILDVIDEHALIAIKDASTKKATNAVKQIINAVIFLSGLVGSAKNEDFDLHFVNAHSIDHSLTKLQETSGSLHGERVIFGLIVQLIFEKNPDQDVEKFVAKIDELGLPVSLEHFGIKDNLSEKIKLIARGVNFKKFGMDRESEETIIKSIEKAIIKADAIGKKHYATFIK
jgi:glycerol dehydrogenase-like iron-containing ADH family enzyme